MKMAKLTILAAVFLICCGVPKEDFEALKSELEETKTKLRECSTELAQVKNTPEQRFIRARKLIADNDVEKARKEYMGIVDNFKGTDEAAIASKEVENIDRQIEKERIDEERKKALGYKILKPSTIVEYDDMSIRFEKIWTGKRWSFDDYGHEYRLIDAERGNKHILSRVSITSKNKNPLLPPVLAYQMNNGELQLLGTLGYEFRRWENYGSYLGNHADYGNDFAHSQTIPFNLGLELSDEILDNKPVFLVIKKSGCFKRMKRAIGNPDIQYSGVSCSDSQKLRVEDFDNDYVLLKVFNQSKL